MKHVLYALACLLCIQSPSFAQTFYNTYNLSGFNTSGNSIALLNNADKDIVFGSYAQDQNMTWPNYYLLTKTDDLGIPLKALLVDSNYGSVRLTPTLDSGVLVAALSYNMLLVRKYDEALNLVWCNRIPLPAGSGLSYSVSGIDIEKINYPDNAEDDQENYYIIFTFASQDATNYPWDDHFCAVRIDQNGGLVWHKIYYDQQRQIQTGSVVDFGNAICSMPSPLNPSDHWLALVGTRNSKHLYCMLIDESGTPQTSYKRITPRLGPGYSTPDVAWDGDSLVVSSTMTNDGFCSDVNNVSGMSVIKFPLSMQNNSFRGYYYWHDCENYAYTIKVASDGNYIVAGLSGLCSPFQGNTQYPNNPAVLKLDRNMLSEIFFKRYNVTQVDPNSGYHETDALDNTFMTTNYYYDTRLIKTDLNGENCNDVDFDVQRIQLTPIGQDFEYVANDYYDIFPLSIVENNVSLMVEECTEAGDGKHANAINNIPTATQVTVYPTIVHGDNETIVCDLATQTGKTARIIVYNNLGQVVYNNTIKVDASSKLHNINSSLLTKGLNVIKITVGNTIATTQKVVRY